MCGVPTFQDVRCPLPRDPQAAHSVLGLRGCADGPALLGALHSSGGVCPQPLVATEPGDPHVPMRILV